MPHMKTLDAEDIPVVIMHWTTLPCGWPNTKPFELRKMLERRLRIARYDAEIINCWVREARVWERTSDPKVLEEKRRNYFKIALV